VYLVKATAGYPVYKNPNLGLTITQGSFALLNSKPHENAPVTQKVD
jgi:hypothetical protein